MIIKVSRRRRRAKKILHHNRSDFLFSVAEPQPSQRDTESKPWVLKGAVFCVPNKRVLFKPTESPSLNVQISQFCLKRRIRRLHITCISLQYVFMDACIIKIKWEVRNQIKYLDPDPSKTFVSTRSRGAAWEILLFYSTIYHKKWRKFGPKQK